jgi:hypothetical protein
LENRRECFEIVVSEGAQQQPRSSDHGQTLTLGRPVSQARGGPIAVPVILEPLS